MLGINPTLSNPNQSSSYNLNQINKPEVTGWLRNNDGGSLKPILNSAIYSAIAKLTCANQDTFPKSIPCDTIF